MQPWETGNCAVHDDGFHGDKWDLHNTGFITNMSGAVLGSTGTADADIDWAELYDAAECRGNAPDHLRVVGLGGSCGCLSGVGREGEGRRCVCVRRIAAPGEHRQ